ncbi:TRAP transporter small permease [Agrobacterium sp. rho-13.3]|jgi:TRAP-type C4-dicarboxylate transport system permease small subunit|uniref:TRAP transporter small permease n=1 Tax=Agrobacterium sp. rho-13.3 TaxID=3072980 RepID=UPI002A0E87E0|nr:TRAP transporter small permease [Agrobacterium sp. rho-13.3]MDX8308332.1 TRAP transporter small permease [Agrobacterium sp. rho-13.3]
MRALLGTFVKIIADVAAGIACFGILIVVLLQVIGRLTGHPLPWTEEATRFLFIWMVFLGLAAGFRTVESARVVVFLVMGRRFFQHLAVPIYVGSSVFFFGLMGWTGLTLMRQQIMMNETAATLPMPMWVIGMVMPVSAAIAILAIIESLRTRRDLIALPELGLPAGEIAHADVSITAGH